MKVAYKDLLDSQNSLGNVSSIKKLPSAIKLRLARVVKQVRPELETFEDKRQELLERLGTYDTDKETFKFATPAIAKEFNEELKAMKAETVDIRFDKFALTEFEKNEEVTALDLANLEWLFGSIDEKSEKPEEDKASVTEE